MTARAQAMLLSYSWTPFWLGAKLKAWWNADTVANIALSGSQVTSWTDDVVGMTLAQSVAGARPLYSATSMNGAPGVTFDGTDDNLEITGIGSLPVGGNASIVWGVVSQDLPASTPTLRTMFQYGGNAANNSRAVTRNIVSSVNRGRMAIGDGVGNTTINGTSVDFTGRHMIVGSFGASAAALQVDLTAEGTASVVPSTLSTRARMGSATFASATSFWGGVIRDVLVTTDLTGPEYTLLQNYLYPRRMP